MIFYNTELPHQISPGNLKVFIDFSRPSSLTLVSGDKISNALDLSASSNNAVQATDSQRPVLTANAINGQPAALFTAANNSVMTIAGNSSLDITGGITLYAVYRALSNSPSGGGIFYKDVTGSGGNSPYSIDRGSTGNPNAQFTNSGGTTVTPTMAGNDVNTNIVAEAYYDNTNVSIKTNANAAATSALTAPLRTTPAGALNIGWQKIAVSRPFDGYIAECILFNTILSSSQRLAMRQYLGKKYSVTVT